MTRSTLQPCTPTSRKWITSLLVAILVASPLTPFAGVVRADDEVTTADTLERRESQLDAGVADGGTCSASRGGLTREQELSQLPIVERSAPGLWRRELKYEEPIWRVPGQSGGEVISPPGPVDLQEEADQRWLPGYRPNSTKARAEYEQWEQSQMNRAKVVARPGSDGERSPAGTHQSNQILKMLSPGLVIEPADRDDEIDYIVRSESYTSHPIGSLSELVPQETAEKPQRPPSTYHKSGLTKEEYVWLKELAKNMPPTGDVQDADAQAPGGGSLRGPDPFGVAFDSISAFQGIIPPDPIMAAGPNHLLVTVNQAYRIYDKTGAPLTNTTTNNTFWSGVPNCGGVFDVFADYDEEMDRWVFGGMTIGANDMTYLCVAASNTGDPVLGGWMRYSFWADENVPDTSIDYPHMGIGLDAIYITGRMFNDSSPGVSGRAFALDKADLYSGTLTIAEADLVYDYVQPAKLNGFGNGGWPAPGTPHHFIAHTFGGSTRMWTWTDPMNQGPTIYGNFNDGYSAFAPNAPELDDPGPDNLNDSGSGQWLDLEYRDGRVWSVRSMNCNIGGGTAEGCINWIQIDVTGGSPVVEDTGTYGSANDYRYYPDVAVDRNNNIGIGFTKSSDSTYTGTWTTGRLFNDPAGTLQSPDVLARQGLGNYTDGAGCSEFSPCDRWGDYSGMVNDPDGCTLWYVGEFSDGGSGDWDTHVMSTKFADCSVESAIQLDQATYTCDDALTVTVIDSTRQTSASVAGAVTITTSTGDSEATLPGDWTGTDCIGADCGTWKASYAIASGGASADDGVIDVADGGTLTADYIDPHGGHSNQSRTANVTCQTGLEDGGFLIDGGCEDNTGTEQYRPYIDAGEFVAYTAGIFNPDNAPPLTDATASLVVTGPAATAGLVTVYNPTVHIGTIGQGVVSGAVFNVYLDPAADSASYRLSELDFEVTVTSPGDGFTIPQVITQTNLIQTDDIISTHQECWNFEVDEQGWQDENYVFSYPLTSPPGTVNTVGAPWTRGSNCGSETRTDNPDMDCDTGGTNAFMSGLPGGGGTCGDFAQSQLTLMDDVNYSPIFGPANTGTAVSGQPWAYQWRTANWFYRSDMISGTDAAAAYGHWFASDYQGVANPAQNEVDTLYDYNLIYFVYGNQEWDSATAWVDNPANFDSTGFPATANGDATPGLQWRWAAELLDTDFGADPTTTPATQGLAYDNKQFVYDQYYAEEQVGECTGALGTVTFDQFNYQDCPNGSLGLSVLDGDATGPITVTVTSRFGGDTETLTIGGSGPDFTTSLLYDSQAGVDPEDGTLFVTPTDVVIASYDDDMPVGTVSTATTILCDEGNVVLEAIVDFVDNGDGDGIADTNETINMTLRLRNDGTGTLTNVQATLVTNDPNIDCIAKETASFGAMAGGNTSTNDLASDPFTFKIAPTTQCTDPGNAPTATFNVLITSEEIFGSSLPQVIPLQLDLNNLGSTVVFTEDFEGGAGSFTHEIGPGDDDSSTTSPDANACAPYVDEWFLDVDGGNGGGGGFSCWQDSADSFPNGTYSAGTSGVPDGLNDSLLISPAVTINQPVASVSFDHTYQFGSTATLLIDGLRVDYRVNGGAWNKVTGLPYDGPLIFNWYCNPLCNGVSQLDDAPAGITECFSENNLDGEQIFALENSAVQPWTNVQGTITGLTPGDQLEFGWRMGSMNSEFYGIASTGGYSLDNVQITEDEFECDTAVNPNVGCELQVNSVGNLQQLCGDDDAIIEPTETWSVDVELKNLLDVDSVDAMADLTLNGSSPIAATISGNPQSYGTIPADGGTSTASYSFTIDAAAICVDQAVFDVTGILDNAGNYPDNPDALSVQVGAMAAAEQATQDTDPLFVANFTNSSTLSPVFTVAPAVTSASVDYGFAYNNVARDETATQDSALAADNSTAVSTMSPPFTITPADSNSASVDWATLSYAGNLNKCTQVSLRTPNATDVVLKDFDVAPADPYNVLATYDGPNGGPGTYSLVLSERSGGGCNSQATLTGGNMNVDGGVTAGSWTTNVRVSLVGPGSSTILKNFGEVDPGTHDVTTFYDAQGAGQYSLELTENGGGGNAQLSAGTMDVNPAAECDLGCGCFGPFPPTALRANPSANDVTLTFQGSGAVDATYNIYRGTNDPNPANWGPAIDTGVTDEDLVTPGIQWTDVNALSQTGSDYYYKVTESVPCGGESPL